MRRMRVPLLFFCFITTVFLLHAAPADDAPPLDAFLQSLPELRRGLRHDEILERLQSLGAREPEEDARLRLTRWIAVVSAERALLARAAPLEQLRGRKASTLQDELAALELDAHEALALSRWCRLHGQVGAAESALGRARDLDESLKDETDRLLAEGRGEDVPRGGYFRYRGRFVPLERRDRERALDEALGRLQDAGRPAPEPGFVPSSTVANLAAFERRYGESGPELLRSAAAELREQLASQYEEVRGWLPSYARQPSLRKNLLERFEALRGQRHGALQLIARYDKPEQPQVDAYRKTLESLYARYAELLEIDRRALRAVGADHAHQVLLAIRTGEEALFAIDAYLEGWAPPGLGEASIAPPPSAEATARHVLPGRRQSSLEDVLWVVVHFAAGQDAETIARAEELERNRLQLTPWERLILDELRFDAIDRYNAECASSLDDAERQFVAVVNQYRRILGRAPFEIAERLNVAARKHSREMVELGYFGHISPVARNRTPTDRVRREGYGGSVGENCLGGHADGRGAFEGWYHSPGHHRGMVGEGPHLGIGATRDHGMWTMVAGGTDLSWRSLHRDQVPSEKRRRAELAARLAATSTASGIDEEGAEPARRLLPDLLPSVARETFSRLGDPRALNREGWPGLARFLVEADVPVEWRPLQIATVAAAIEGLALEKQVSTRQALFELVRPLIGDDLPYDAGGSPAERRKQVTAISISWEEVGQFRYRQGTEPISSEVVRAPGRKGDGPSLESPLRILSRRERLAIARQFGGGGETERSVARGLAWLANVQHADGGWRARSFATVDRRFRGYEDRLGLGNAEWEIGMTGLSLLAFLSAGNTPDQGEYAAAVERGIQFLTERIVDYGKFETTSSHYMYNHAIATQALSEAYAYTADPRIGVSAQLCLDYLAYAQHQLSGGWRYDANMAGDTSVAGWVVMALNSGYKAHLDTAGFRGALRFLNSVTYPAYFQIGYTNRQDGGTKRLGAVGMLARLFLEGNPDHAGIRMNAWRLEREPPRAGQEDFYCWYYATLAMFQLGGPSWKTWNEHLIAALLSSQDTDARSPLHGSWPPRGEWSNVGGRIYQTALGVLMLTTYYRYDRVRTPRVAPFTGDLSKSIGPYLDVLRAPDDELVRRVTAAKLVDLFGTAAAPVLIQVLRDPEEPLDVRRTVASLLVDCCAQNHEVALLDLLAAPENQEDEEIQTSIVCALEGVASEESTPALSGYLDHEAHELRGYAASALGRIGGTRAAAAIAKRLEVERDGWCREQMNRALSRLSHQQAVDELVRQALGTDTGARLRVLDGLQLLDQSGLAKRLLAQQASDPDLYARALDEIREHREAAAVPVLIVLLESTDRDTRAEAIKLLGVLTHQGHGFDADRPQEERDAAVVRWRDWWSNHLEEYRQR